MSGRSRVMWTTLIGVPLAMSAVGVVMSVTAGAQSKQNWTKATGDLGNTRFSTLSEINTETIKNLGAAWVSDKFDDGGSSHVTPVVDNGIMFVVAGAKIYALDAKTGKTIWKVGASGASPTGGGRGATATPNTQGVAVAEGKVFAGFTHAQMYALDEKTGATVWHSTLANVAPLPAPVEPEGGSVRVAIPTEGNLNPSPVYAAGVIYTGFTPPGEGTGMGRAIALDAKDGHQLWSWNAIPGPGEPGHETWAQNSDFWKSAGGGVWNPPVVDTDLGLVYYGTGNASPNRVRLDLRPGNNLYTGSVVALDSKTGKLRWYFQLEHHEMWQGDVATPLVLYDTEVNGKPQKGLAAIRPDGTLFLLDRATGKPIWPVEERPVRQSKIDVTSPTQPFPVGRKSLTERDCSQWKPVPGFTIRCEFFEPVSGQGQNILTNGPSTRSSPMSYDPQTGYFYIQGTDRLDWNWSPLEPFSWDENIYAYLTVRVPGLWEQALLRFLVVDPKTYKVVWSKEMRAAPNNYGTGGWLTTAGGLAFHRLEDGNLVGYDAKTGDELWKFQSGVVATDIATPMSYEVDSQQYISVLENSQVWAFRLGGTIPQPPAPKLNPWDDIFLRTGAPKDTQVIQCAVQDVYNYKYDITPLKARVKVGKEVTFSNFGGPETYDFVGVDPNTYQENGSWTTGPILPTRSVTLIFDKPGVYLYHDKDHPWSYAEVIAVEDTP